MAKATSESFLVTIPQNDILKSSPQPEESPLVLLQLPANCSPEQLQHFLADETQVSLVTDTASYSVQTLGTSNSLILLPPSDKQCTKDDEKQDPAVKRAKSCRTARLLHKGNGASYWELRPRSTVALNQWKSLAKKKGPKVVPADWARHMHVAPSQVVQWLTASVPAVPLEVYENCSSATMDEKYPTYTILDPEDAIVCQEAILATLTECYGGTFESQPIDATTFAQQASERVAGDAPKSMYPTDMMLHCARRLCTGEEPNATGMLRFDVQKVAVCVACHILRRKDAWSPTDLHDQLQLELPGTSQPFDDKWLQGSAVKNNEQDWVYLLANSHLTWEDLWATGKCDWSREELDPYLACLALSAPNCPIDDLLAQHTVKDGTDTTVYRRK